MRYHVGYQVDERAGDTVRLETKSVVGSAGADRVEAVFTDMGTDRSTDLLPGVRLLIEANPATGALDRIADIQISAQPGVPVTADGLRQLADVLPDLVGIAASARGVTRTAQAVAATGREGAEVVEVAKVYRQAVLDGRPPIKAITEQLHLSTPTAARRVRKAKDLGLLPERAEDVRGGHTEQWTE